MRLLLLTLIAISSQVYGQESDTLITAAGDTLFGEVVIELPEAYEESVTYKRGKSKVKFRAFEIQEFRKDGDRYHPVKLGQLYRIMKLDQEGYLSLYRFREDQSYDFGTRLLVKADGATSYIPNFAFKRVMSEFLIECESVADNIRAGAYKKSELDKIITDFNACVDKRTLQAQLSIENVKVVNDKKIELIDAIKAKIDETNAELHSLLNDIKSKVVQGKVVPGYLKNALEEQTQEITDVTEEVAELLAAL